MAGQSAAHQDCVNFCCATFNTYQEHPPGPGPDLRNRLHPILHKNNFHQDINRQAIEYPLRLVSHILESPGMVPFVNTLTRGKLQDENGNAVTPAEVHKADRQAILTGRPKPVLVLAAQLHQDQVTDETKKHAQLVLEALGDMIRFELADLPATTAGECRPVPDMIDSDARLVFPRGSRSLIRLSRRRYERLIKLDHTSPANEVYLLRTAFALTMIHELGHSLCTAARGIRCPEPCLSSGSYGEMGYALEEQLFGSKLLDNVSLGVPSAVDLHPSWRCTTVNHQRLPRFGCLLALPSQAMESIYTDPARKYSYATRGPRPVCDVIYRVPMVFYEMLYTTAFWDDVAKNNQVQALRPPVVASWMFFTNRPAGVALRPLNVHDVGISDYVKNILRKAAKHQPPDPSALLSSMRH